MKWTGFILFILFFPALVVYAEEIQEVIPAIKIEESAIIDGDISDPVWQKAFHDPGRVYIDGEMLKEVFTKEPIESWVYYNNEGIFMAFKCIDEDIIVEYRQDKNTPDLGRGADDVVGFNFIVNPDLHYDANSQYWYMINPASTYYFRPAVGRALKKEFEGEVLGKAKVYPGYWTAEVLLKWTAVDYPNPKKDPTNPQKILPQNMLLLLQRRYKKAGMSALLAHHPRTFLTAGTDTRLHFCRFEGVIPPQKGVEIKIAPSLYAGWSEQEKWEKQAGLDFRLRPTNEKNIFLTLYPDFRNTEQYVGRIDPTYGPRLLQDTRFFFQEGNQILKLPWNFYSRKIEDIDLGLSGYGKMWDTSFVVLGTMYRGGDHNLILRNYKDWGQFHWGGAYLGHRKTGNHVIWTDFSQNSKHFEFMADVGQSMLENKEAGRKYWAMGKYKTQGLSSGVQFIAIDEKYADDLGFHPFKGIYGPTWDTLIQKSWDEGRLSYQFYTQWLAQNKYDGSIHRRTGDLSFWHTRGENGYYVSVWGGRYEENEDLWGYLMYYRNFSNRQKYLRTSYTIARRAGEPLNQIDASGAYRYKNLTTSLSGQLLWYEEFKHQLIVSANYELTKALGLGTRLVYNQDGTNIYFAFSRTGMRGAEVFVIIGDPHANKFQKRVIGKVVMAF